MLPFTHVMDFLADKFAGLRAGRFAFFGVLSCAFDGFLVGHFILLVGNLPVDRV
jgi:hypothetical protein